MLLPAAMALHSKREMSSHRVPGNAGTCVLSQWTRRASGQEGFSVSWSTPKAHPLVDGKIIDFSGDNNPSVFIQ